MMTGKDKKAIKEKKEPVKKEKIIKVKESEFLKLQEEAADYKDKFVRLFAEFDNARKRMDREKMEFVKYANEGLITEFLEVMDNLERSVQAAKENHQDYSAFLKGIEIVMKQINGLLQSNNVKPIDTAGKSFDPHCHEVLMQEETEEFEDGKIIEEFQKGFMLGDRVVRTSKVKVAKKKESSGEVLTEE